MYSDQTPVLVTMLTKHKSQDLIKSGVCPQPRHSHITHVHVRCLLSPHVRDKLGDMSRSGDINSTGCMSNEDRPL